MKRARINPAAAAYAAQLARRTKSFGSVATIDNAGNVLVSSFLAEPGTLSMPCERFAGPAGEDPVITLRAMIQENPALAGGSARASQLYAEAHRYAFGKDPPQPKVRT